MDAIDRKRRREEIAHKVAGRRHLISATSSARMDMDKVQSILSGPRLSWDWAARNEEEGLVVDFHQDSRSALRTHISKTMSQMAASRDGTEELKQILETKKKLTQKVKVQTEEEVQLWQETQLVEEEIEMDAATYDEDCAPTQVYIRSETLVESSSSPKPSESLEPLVESLSSEPLVESLNSEPLVEPLSPANSFVAEVSISLPPNMTQDRDNDASENSQQSEPAEASFVEPNLVKTDLPDRKKKSVNNLEEFKAWLAERAQKKRSKRRVRNEFVDAEAEESEDEQLGGLVGGRKAQADDDEEEEEDELSDLEGLMASVEDEFDVHLRSKKDGKRLGKMHAKWMAERDQELEKAIADREFLRRGRGIGLDDSTTGGLSRLQRKLKAQREALVEQFDAEGNRLAPEYESESEYDSMEMDSDEFCDEEFYSDEETKLTEAELAIRKERKERETDRRKRDSEFKREMQQRRLLLKEKLRQTRLNKEKDSREIQAGIGIMAEEDQEAFKNINRTAMGVFGYAPSGVSTQSTTPSAVFSFLSLSAPLINTQYKSRRSSIGSLELE